jgi:hypothetical protein
LVTIERFLPLINFYKKKIYSLALHLIDDEDRAYEIAAFCMAETFSKTNIQQSEFILADICKSMILRCKAEIPATKTSFSGRPKSTILSFVNDALQSLSIEEKSFILLRDQLNLSYKEIGHVFLVSASEAQHKTLMARTSLRKKMEDAIHNA